MTTCSGLCGHLHDKVFKTFTSLTRHTLDWNNRQTHTQETLTHSHTHTHSHTPLHTPTHTHSHTHTHTHTPGGKYNSYCLTDSTLQCISYAALWLSILSSTSL